MAGRCLNPQKGLSMESTPAARLTRARIALEGLSVGDGLGGFFEFGSLKTVQRYLENNTLPPSPWRYTDDTSMALSIYQVLRDHNVIQQDELAQSFAAHFDRTRGYGMGARALISRMKKGAHWRDVSRELFNGGSYGNGGAMRVAPLGAYFADDLDALTHNAALSAEITHAHPEGIAGAIAVAVAAAYACRLREAEEQVMRSDFIDVILPHVPESEVKQNIVKARDLAADTSLSDAVALLGNGSRVTAQDTVPFALWSAGENLAHYEQAIWNTALAGGDVDTTCAMVGGIVASYTGVEGIPPTWIAMREPLPDWALGSS